MGRGLVGRELVGRVEKSKAQIVSITATMESSEEASPASHWVVTVSVQLQLAGP